MSLSLLFPLFLITHLLCHATHIIPLLLTSLLVASASHSLINIFLCHIHYVRFVITSYLKLSLYKFISCSSLITIHRLQTGMRGAFGKPNGIVARVKIGQVIFSVRCKDNVSQHVIEATRRAAFKFPGRQKIVVCDLSLLPSPSLLPFPYLPPISSSPSPYLFDIRSPRSGDSPSSTANNTPLSARRVASSPMVPTAACSTITELSPATPSLCPRKEQGP